MHASTATLEIMIDREAIRDVITRVARGEAHVRRHQEDGDREDESGGSETGEDVHSCRGATCGIVPTPCGTVKRIREPLVNSAHFPGVSRRVLLPQDLTGAFYDCACHDART